ncbi:4Fe-4S dicluster domain-containing protein [Syntrophomonas curvata]
MMPDTSGIETRAFFKAVKLDAIDDSLQKEIKMACGVDVETCLECGKCSGGCSNTHIFDITARQIVKLIKMGQEEPLLSMDALWTCVSCQLCGERCPSGIDIARIMDCLREKAYKKGIKATRYQVQLFHELMLDAIKKTGRVAEGQLMIKFNLKTGRYFKDADLGRRLFLKGKIKPFSSKIRNREDLCRIFQESIGRGRDQ